MPRAILVVVMVGFCSLLGSAQTSTLPCSANCTLARSQPFSIVYDWAPTAVNPDIADGFRLYQDGTVVSQATIGQLVNGSIAFPFASGIGTSGTYLFTVSAFTDVGGESVGDPITVTIAKGKPAKPTGGRIP